MSKGKYLTPEIKEKIVTLYKTGITMREVADQLGVSQSAVSRVVKASGYDRIHVGSRIAKSCPNIPARVPDTPAQKPLKTAFTALSRAVKMRGDVTTFIYEISTESDVIHIESDSVLMDIKIDAIDSFIEELNGIKQMLGSPS